MAAAQATGYRNRLIVRQAHEHATGYNLGMQLIVDRVEDFATVVVQSPSLSDREFWALCERFENHAIEYDSVEQEILIMPPTGLESGERNSDITTQLGFWARQDGRGRTFDSSTEFRLPNGSLRSPDASWIEKSKVRAAKARQPEASLPELCPDFVIELRSPSDRLRPLQRKMQEWIDNGAQLAWLIDPQARTAGVYRPDRDIEDFKNVPRLDGEGPVVGFALDLTPIWAEL